MHRLDARSKIILLLIYSIALFFCEEWLGLLFNLAFFILTLIFSKLPVSKIFIISAPVYVIVLIAVFGNSFVFTGDIPLAENDLLYPLYGEMCFSLTGFSHGVFYGLRILLLVWTSLIFCFSTTQEEITSAISWFLKPLRLLKVPTDDIAMIASIALRFIPLTAAEFFQIKDAQWARGRAFDDGTLIVRLKAYCSIFIPLLVNLFRRADILSRAMDSRLYGTPGYTRTALYDTRLDVKSIFVLLVGSVTFICVAFVL